MYFVQKYLTTSNATKINDNVVIKLLNVNFVYYQLVKQRQQRWVSRPLSYTIALFNHITISILIFIREIT